MARSEAERICIDFPMATRKDLALAESRTLASVADGGSAVAPALVAAASDIGARRFLEFLAVTIENPNTRTAYFHACRRFFAWCEARADIDEIVDIEPMQVASYIR